MKNLYRGFFFTLIIFIFFTFNYQKVECKIVRNRAKDFKVNIYSLKKTYRKVHKLLRFFFKGVIKENTGNSNVYNPKLIVIGKNGKIKKLKLPDVKGEKPKELEESDPENTEAACKENKEIIASSAIQWLSKHPQISTLSLNTLVEAGLLSSVPKGPEKGCHYSLKVSKVKLPGSALAGKYKISVFCSLHSKPLVRYYDNSRLSKICAKNRYKIKKATIKYLNDNKNSGILAVPLTILIDKGYISQSDAKCPFYGAYSIMVSPYNGGSSEVNFKVEVSCSACGR